MQKSDLNNFNDINDEYLQAYNRLTVTFNLNSSGRENEALAYLKQFDARGRRMISIVTQHIKSLGLERIKKDIQAKLRKGSLVDSLEEDLEGATA